MHKKVEKINLKKIDDTIVPHLIHFFEDQAKTSRKIWKKEEVFHLSDGTEFNFTNDIFIREKKEGKEKGRYCYEIISKKEKIGTGTFGLVFKIKGTITFIEDTFSLKTQGKDGLSRLVKIQQHSPTFTPHNAIKEYNCSKNIKYLAIKPPTLTNLFYDAVSYTVLNYLPGTQLLKIIEEDYSGVNILSLENRFIISKTLLNALQAQVTEINIVHRDIKPENILICMDNPEKGYIIDFGLGINANDQDNTSKGTPLYMAPELFSYPYTASIKADVFSLARVLSQLWRVDRGDLYNKNNSVKTKQEWIEKITTMCSSTLVLEGMFKDISGLNDDLKQVIGATLKGMLHVEKEKRLSIEEAINMFSAFNNESALSDTISSINSCSSKKLNDLKSLNTPNAHINYSFFSLGSNSIEKEKHECTMENNESDLQCG